MIKGAPLWFRFGISVSFPAMIKELQMCQDSYSEMLEMYLRQIFIKLQRHFKFSVNTVNSHAAEEIDKAISYFSEHYNEPISIDDYAVNKIMSVPVGLSVISDYMPESRQSNSFCKKEYIMPKHCFKIHNTISMRSHKLSDMIIHCISAAFFKRQKDCHLLNIVKTYKKNCKKQKHLCFLQFLSNYFLFWQVIYPFVFYNDSVNRKEMNFHEKQIPQLY